MSDNQLENDNPVLPLLAPFKLPDNVKMELANKLNGISIFQLVGF